MSLSLDEILSRFNGPGPLFPKIYYFKVKLFFVLSAAFGVLATPDFGVFAITDFGVLSVILAMLP